MVQHQPGGRKYRPHHISSIAHHFFDEAMEGEGQLSGSREITVTGTCPGQLIAWLCAQLVRKLSHRNFLLNESPSLPWSAASYLQDLEPADEEGPGATDPSSFPDVVQHLGLLGHNTLNRWESAPFAGLVTPNLKRGTRFLVWCVAPNRAGSIKDAYQLGRTIRLIQPDQIELVILEPACLWPTEKLIQGNPADLKARCLGLADVMVSQAPAHASYLKPAQGREAAPATILDDGLWQRLLGPNDSD